VWMPVSGPVTLSAEETAALKSYLAGGGFLVLEARGGSETAAKAAKRVADDLGLAFESTRGAGLLTGKLDPAKGFSVEKVHFRKDGKFNEIETDLQFLKGGGTVVGVLSPLDISVSATGVRCWGLRGHAPTDARRILANILLLRSSRPLP